MNSTHYIDFAICILVHNEERMIESTIHSIAQSLDYWNLNSPHFKFQTSIPILIYANGCTDQTLSICRRIESQFLRMHEKGSPPVFHLQMKVIERASKINAWNIALKENQARQFLFFTDGDIQIESRTLLTLALQSQLPPTPIITSGRLLPLNFPYSLCQLGIQKWMVGFMQLPLKQDYLAGALYGVQPKKLLQKITSSGFTALPEEAGAEDGFLEFLLPPEELRISTAKVYYIPGDFNDYIHYLARIQWQNQKLKLILGDKLFLSTLSHSPFQKKIWKKLLETNNWCYFLLAVLAKVTQFTFKFVFRNRIERVFQTIAKLPVGEENVLSQITRAHSTK